MPSYISNPQFQQVSALYRGDNIALVNDATTDTGVTKTIQVAIGPEVVTNSQVSLVNGTNQTVTAEYAYADADGNYQPLTANGNAITAATNTSVNFPCSVGWIRCTFGTAPTSGSLIISR